MSERVVGLPLGGPLGGPAGTPTLDDGPPPPLRSRGPDASDTVWRDAAIRVQRSPVPGSATREDGSAIETTERIEIAISSETPVERIDWWSGERFLEVLAHTADAVDLTYAADGLPFLVDHATRDQVGLVTDVRLDADGILRGAVLFSDSVRGQEIERDVRRGIRRKISVGYRVSRYVLVEEDDEQGDTYRADRWQPMEASTVAIPADYTVGVGRSADARTRAPRHTPSPVSPAPAAARETTPQPPTPPPSLAAPAEESRMSIPTAARPGAAGSGSATPGADGARAESRELALTRLAHEHKRSMQEAMAWIEAERTVESVRAELLDLYHRGQGNITPPNPGAALQLSEREEHEYSMVRAITALAERDRSAAPFEFEVSDEIAKRMGRSSKGMYVPTSLRANKPGAASVTQAIDHVRSFDPILAGQLMQRSQLSVGAATKGAESRFTEPGSFIDLLRARTVLLRMGAQFMPGLQGDVGMLQQTAPGSVTWGAETNNAGLSSLSLGLRTMSPKIAQSATSYTRQLLAQSVESIENLVRLDLAAIHARGVDLAGLAGTGAGSQPRGILNTVGIGAVVGGPNGAQPTYEHVVGLQREVAIDNALMGAIGYVCHPQVASRLMLTQKFAGTNGDSVWQGNILDGQMAGFGAMASTQLPSGGTKGTSTDISPILFGAFDSMLIGEWGAMELLVDPYTLGPALIKVMSFQMIDVFLRYVESFAVMADARP